MTGRAVAVGAVEEFPVGAFRIVEVGGHSVGLIRLADGSVHALRNRCPHKGAPICQGIVGGTWPPSEPGQLAFGREGEVLVCPWHGFEYDIRTGRELYRDEPTVLRKFGVTVQGGTVYVELWGGLREGGPGVAEQAG